MRTTRPRALIILSVSAQQVRGIEIELGEQPKGASINKYFLSGYYICQAIRVHKTDLSSFDWPWRNRSLGFAVLKIEMIKVRKGYRAPMPGDSRSLKVT